MTERYSKALIEIRIDPSENHLPREQHTALVVITDPIKEKSAKKEITSQQAAMITDAVGCVLGIGDHEQVLEINRDLKSGNLFARVFNPLNPSQAAKLTLSKDTVNEIFTTLIKAGFQTLTGKKPTVNGEKL